MRRGSTVEELYTEAVALAERGGALEQQAHEDEASRDAARQCFADAIRIFSRLAIVESAAKRAVVQGVVSDLRARLAMLDNPSPVPVPISKPQPELPRATQPPPPSDAVDADTALTRAMEIHQQARDAEDAGNRTQCIELYLSAGDWYMKAYSAFEPEAKSAKDAVREQIEYVIGHVSDLKKSTAQEPIHKSAAMSVSSGAVMGEMHWPVPPEESPELTAKPAPEMELLVHPPAADVSMLDDAAWPKAPLAPTPVLQSAAPQLSTLETAGGDGLAWPLPPGAETDVEAFDWPMPPVSQHTSKRRSFRNRSTPPSRTSSHDQLPVSRHSSTNSIISSRAPAVDDEETVTYSPAELDVLRRSSQINGHIFVPWLDDVDAHENFRSIHLYVDPDGMVPLSAKQVRKGAKWMRPSEYALLCAQVPVMIDSICPQVVKQDIVTDCSFVASLCIAAAYEQRFQKRLITNIIYPIDPSTRQPVYNPTGKYIVKLWANGVPRKVVIDDLLPVNTETRALMCSCTTRQNELWVSLIEKAYLKLHGGYDYPGGNSGIDLFALTGWIPERIPISDLTAENAAREDRLWEQLKSAFHFGDCIITMTTGDIGREDAIQIGLVPMHVYAVLNVYETTVFDETLGESKKIKLLHVKNPWRKLSWRGPYSNSDTATWQGPLGEELRKYQDQYYALGETKKVTDSGDDVGLFWIDLDSVKLHFESLYLNWNPELFPHKYVIHEHWPVELGPVNDSTTLAYNPQYSVRFTRRRSESVASDSKGTTTSTSTVWVLLTRHVSTVERDSDHSAQQFLTLHVYRGTEGRRVYYNQDAMHRGTYSNNPHTLLSLDVDFDDDEPEPSFTLVASQYEKFAPLDYTLSVFSTTPFVCRPVPHMDSAPNAVVLSNEWKAETAGGRPFFSTFMHNPQYHVQLDPTAELRRLWILLETTGDSETTDIPLNLRVITHSQWRACGLPAVSAATSPLRILSSGEYRPGFCFLELDGGEGDTMLGKDCSDLVVIPSTFEPDTMATFRIRIVSEPPEAIGQVSELPMEGYGMQSTMLHGQWSAKKGTAVGCASYGCYTFNPKYLVHVSEESYLFARLVPARGLATRDGSSSAALPSCNISIYASNSDGTLLLSTNPTAAFRHATSDGGAYASGNPSGVVTPSHVVFPGGWYVIIPSTYDPQEGEFELRVYSSKRTVVRHLEG